MEYVAGAAAATGELNAGPLFDLWHEGKFDARGVHQWAEAGDPVARKGFAASAGPGAGAGQPLCGPWDLPVIIGGGVSAGSIEFIEPLHEKPRREHSSMLYVADAVIQRSALGDDALLRGLPGWRLALIAVEGETNS